MEKGIKGIALFRTVFIVPIMIAPVVVGLIWRYLFDANFGLINYIVQFFGFQPKIWLGTPGLALPAVIITDIWQWTPFMFILFLAGLQSLPSSPVEAAQVDGASTWADHPPGKASPPHSGDLGGHYPSVDRCLPEPGGHVHYDIRGTRQGDRGFVIEYI